MGDTVNFRSHKESYKDKKAVKNSSDEILIFRDTHEPIIDRRTGERAGRDWRGMPDGTVRKTPASFNCGTYNSSRKQNDKKCSSHCIQEDAVRQILLETIRYALKSVRMDEAAFIQNMRSASEVRDKSEVKKLRTDLSKKEKRFADLDLLIKKVYEDNAMGKLPDRRYEMLSSDYEKEQQELEISMKEIREKLIQFEDDTNRTEEFLSLVHKYTDIQELTPAIINEFVDKVLIHKSERIDGERVQEIEVYLNFIGKVELPAQEISEKELAEIREKRRIRERNAIYQRRRRAKFMPKTKAILTEMDGAEKERTLAEARAQAEELPAEIIENYLRCGDTKVGGEYRQLMEEAAKTYVDKIFAELKTHGYNPNLMKLYIMGGGAKVVELVGDYDCDNVTFNHDIRANAKGYEYFCYMKLRRQKAMASAG